MSGIFGIVRAPGVPVTQSELTLMADELKHRGPDGIRFSARENVGLGHCMLHSTPESLHEILPFRDEASGLKITADARIDNREQLISAIPARSASGQPVSDSYLILCAYMKWGEDCVDHLLGDFAFALWDERAQSLFVARDHMGCKPFYYHAAEGLFVFASSANAVACVPQVCATLNEGRVADYLVEELEGIDKTCTFFNEISRLPPAHCGFYRYGHFQPRQYWTLGSYKSAVLTTDEEYLEAFTGIYSEAVRARLRCHIEPASMLSGGLDSSTIVALARDMLAAEGMPPLRTFSAISDDAQNCPETRSIEAIVAQGRLSSRCWSPSGTDQYQGTLDVTMDVMEDPFDGAWTLLESMYLGAAQDGRRVLLDGMDGHLAMGAPANYLTFLLREGQWRTAWQEARGLSQHYYLGQRRALALYLLSLRSRFTPRTLRNLKRRLGNASRYRELMAGRLISPGLAHRANLPGRMLEYEDTLTAQESGIHAWARHAAQVPYLTAAIERYERLASYHGVEGRHPLLDIRLLEFSAHLPLRQKARGGWSKFLLRRLSNERLPQAVAWRDDWERLGWDFAERQVRKFGVERGYPVDAMKETLAPYVNPSDLEKCLCEDVPGGNEKALTNAWLHYCLYRWLARHGPNFASRGG